MKKELLDLLTPDSDEPRNTPLTIAVTASQKKYFRETCKKAKEAKLKNPGIAVGQLLVDLCDEVQALLGEVSEEQPSA